MPDDASEEEQAIAAKANIADANTIHAPCANQLGCKVMLSLPPLPS